VISCRFFASATGVENAALSAWRHAVGQKGRELLCQFISETVEHYIFASKARNHEVSEAALHALGEVVAKLPPESTRNYLPAIGSCICSCINDSSWPVRDAACASSGFLVSQFPVEVLEQDQLICIMDAWMKHLEDSIWSVRDNALSGTCCCSFR
jgi:hypothetical protein